MGDEDGGDPELALDFLDLDLHGGAQVPVERRERLVEQQHLGTDDERARQRDALLLAARQLARSAVLQTVKLHERQRLRNPARDLGLGKPRILRP